jgi:hypothetical protein
MATVDEIVREHIRASKELRAKLKTPEQARQFLIRAGILSKDGKKLAKRYR